MSCSSRTAISAPTDTVWRTVTNRSGPWEIWDRSADGTDRPVVTAANFPDGRNKWFMNPAPSPNGERLIFTRIDSDGANRLWMMSWCMVARREPVCLSPGDGRDVVVDDDKSERKYNACGTEEGCLWESSRVVPGRQLDYLLRQERLEPDLA